jgi:hypothetical protein
LLCERLEQAACRDRGYATDHRFERERNASAKQPQMLAAGTERRPTVNVEAFATAEYERTLKELKPIAPGCRSGMGRRRRALR